MVSTVTTSTVTTVTTVASMGMGATLTFLALFALVFFLTTKELAAAGQGNRTQLLSHFANVAVTPLLMTFAFVVFMTIREILSRLG